MAIWLFAAVLGGCASPPSPVDYARTYPAEPPRWVPLDIQVFRGEKHLELTNTTARAFGPSTIWLNGWYSRPIDGLGVGQTLRVRLREFRDRDSIPFRGGGFFATQRPEVLVLAELETEEEGETVFYRLVVVGGPDR